MTGGQWVSHPGNSGVTYTVKITDPGHFVTQGTSDFTVTSEQYYMHTDPANKVLATTEFPSPGADGPHVGNGPVAMPVVWTKMYGAGRVFYTSLGHNAATVSEPDPLRVLTRGLLWAAKAETA
jgi:type 1 glutamine amidotransferase